MTVTNPFYDIDADEVADESEDAAYADTDPHRPSSVTLVLLFICALLIALRLSLGTWDAAMPNERTTTTMAPAPALLPPPPPQALPLPIPSPPPSIQSRLALQLQPPAKPPAQPPAPKQLPPERPPSPPSPPSAPAFEHAGEDCWWSCNEAPGACPAFCGPDGACCKRGDPLATHLRECDGGGCESNHCCIASAVAPPTLPPLPPVLPPSPPPPGAPPPPPIEHEGDNCWDACSRAVGVCGFCGASGACCRRDDTSHLTNLWECGHGQLGCDSYHCCTAVGAQPPGQPPSPPRPPERPPPPPDTPSSASSVARRLNTRFRNARPSSDLSLAGVVMHAFDRISESWSDPWAPCDTTGHGPQCQNGYTGRMSCFLSFQSMQLRADRVAIPLPQWGGGVVVSPIVQLRCAFGDDGSTYRTSNGCYSQWCDRSHPWSGAWPGGHPCGFGGSGQINRNWRPADLDKMLELYADHSQHYGPPGWYHGYNELIYGSGEWNSKLPHTIEAFYILGTERAWWEQHDSTIGRHRAFLTKYGLTDNDVPLLAVTASNWDAPFSVPH